MGVIVVSEDVLEIFTARRQNQFVSFYLSIVLRYQSDIVKELLIPEKTKCFRSIAVKIVPLESKFFSHISSLLLETLINVVIELFIWNT